ncbi:MAG: tripartite tricarboxylate transporter substrate binding protein [Cupriavidus sp.]|nr:tripartite tricarboxylate transporter substrate binding protein [Cupriavidus sp.]NUT16629.1 tripartite tricarboxylate transporter substrate binding protein [Cupriavidus sp.]
MKRRACLASLAVLASALPLALPCPAKAQEKPIQIIVPFGPGGSGDISARLLAEFLMRKTGRSVVVDNRPGANGIIGVQAALGAPADGSVLLLATTSTHLANPSLFRKLPYDPGKDFRLVGSFGPGSTYMLVRPDAPYKTLQDFVEAARAGPGKINYGYFNATSKVTAAMFAHEAGIELTAIPYKQVSQAMTELIAGQIQVVFTDTVAGDAFVASGRLRALAVHASTRLKRYPNVPLLAQNYPNLSLPAGLLGIDVPAATPLQMQQRLNQLVNEAVTSEPIRSKLEGFGFAPARVSLQDLASFERLERERWKGYVDIAGIDIQ